MNGSANMLYQLREGTHFHASAYPTPTQPVARSQRLIFSIISMLTGLFLIGGGFFYGSTSHNVYYQHVKAGLFHILTINNGTYAFQKAGTSIYYIIDPRKFSPHLNDARLQRNEPITTLIYKDDPQTLSLKVDNIQTSATTYAVVQFALADKKIWRQQVYSATEYIQNPQGIIINNWLQGSLLAGAGFLIVIIVSVWSFSSEQKQKRRQRISSTNAQIARLTPSMLDIVSTYYPDQDQQDTLKLSTQSHVDQQDTLRLAANTHPDQQDTRELPSPPA
ncbi:hypothetical protein [Dictyobacter arantiisoli]|uniref:Uncharacterized protein n=1 Tax=Dictyobacter arantiisoli TaxID=2014874 RepID=A0A5A5T8D4_9CHLR|nr:hypothetical protein [Dictyobacter arantiisoli]GCF07617.1 hypothetical protein KDI_11810 [Dictyobacter arantiisoli]